MNPIAFRIGFVLLTLAHLDWARLALTGGLPVFGGVLLVEALAFAAIAARPALLRWGALLAALCELGGILLLGISGVALAYNVLVIVGLALLAWRNAAAPGAYVALGGLALFGALEIMAGSTFLLLGLVLALAGWGAVSWSALVAAQPSGTTSADAQAGARP